MCFCFTLLYSICDLRPMFAFNIKKLKGEKCIKIISNASTISCEHGTPANKREMSHFSMSKKSDAGQN